MAWWRISRLVFVAGLLPLGLAAQGGPPFRTDDPDTPGNRNWEINFGLMAERNPTEGDYALPNLDLNYGLGDRLQLKYELPLSVHESRSAPGYLAAGPGNSLLGVKWRFYERALPMPSVRTGDDLPRFAVSIYPQLIFNNPTRSEARGIVEPGPQFLLPIEGEAKLGPIRIVLENGRWFRAKSPDLWIHGLMLGRQWTRKTEVYLELYYEHGVPRTADVENDLTVGIGTRHPITKGGRIRFLGMGGRSPKRATLTNGQPSWLAYVGLQVLVGPGERSGSFMRGN